MAVARRHKTDRKSLTNTYRYKNHRDGRKDTTKLRSMYWYVEQTRREKSEMNPQLTNYERSKLPQWLVFILAPLKSLLVRLLQARTCGLKNERGPCVGVRVYKNQAHSRPVFCLFGIVPYLQESPRGHKSLEHHHRCSQRTLLHLDTQITSKRPRLRAMHVVSKSHPTQPKPAKLPHTGVVAIVQHKACIAP